MGLRGGSGVPDHANHTMRVVIQHRRQQTGRVTGRACARIVLRIGEDHRLGPIHLHRATDRGGGGRHSGIKAVFGVLQRRQHCICGGINSALIRTASIN